jgi:hypothetical protein
MKEKKRSSGKKGGEDITLLLNMVPHKLLNAVLNRQVRA